MTKLSTPFQLFLFLSLFLFYCPPSLQMPTSQKIYRDAKRFKEQLGNYRKIFTAERGHAYQSMKPRKQGRHIRETPIVYKTSSVMIVGAVSEAPANGAYSVQFGFGTPPTQVEIVLDTGSSVTWIQCQPCHDCYEQFGPIFDPAKSNSYKALGCNSKQCQQLEIPPKCPATRQTCPYKFSYADEYVTTGDFATENITFFPHTTLPNIPIGCSHVNKDKGDFGPAAGVFGLGRGSLSFISQSQYSAFSYCLTHDGSPKDSSYLQFGTSATFSDADLTIPMFRNTKLPSLYFVGLTGISVDEQIFSVPPINSSTGYGGATIDCGTIVTRFPNEVYERLREAFVKAATGHAVVGRSGPFDTCFALTSQSEADFPIIAFHFGEALLTLRPENVMISMDQYTCLGFAAADFSYTLIGSHQQQGIRVSFDVGSSKVGFLLDNC